MSNLLVIEDSPTQAAKLKFSLEAAGHAVVVAAEGASGLYRAQTLQIDLIVLDVQLPDMTGFEVCQRLKSDMTLRLIPVIMYSTENKLKFMVTAYEKGADYYVVKGADGEKVLGQLIATVFNRRRRRVQHGQ